MSERPDMLVELPSDYAQDGDPDAARLRILAIGFDYVLTVQPHRPMAEGVVFATSGTRSINRTSLIAALFKMERADPGQRDLESARLLLLAVAEDLRRRVE